ncbi:MAG: ARMT1-like domain-containing protein [Candidatus Bipolaricaulota bacterium]
MIRSSLRAVRLAGGGDEAAWPILAEAAEIASRWDRSLPPILLGAEVGRLLRQKLGVADPYQAEKRVANAAALAHYPDWVREAARAPDPLLHALRLAAAGNSLDLGIHARLDVAKSLGEATTLPFSRCDYDVFRKRLGEARDVLYLADNAGEIVLDRILIEEILRHGVQVTVAVRGGPTLNDATADDAAETGLDRIAEVITTGSDVPGTSLAACSPEFRVRFRGAGLILSKGMGNFEGLAEEPAPLFFLLQAKCGPVAQETGVEIGGLVLLAGRG